MMMTLSNGEANTFNFVNNFHFQSYSGIHYFECSDYIIWHGTNPKLVFLTDVSNGCLSFEVNVNTKAILP